MKCPRCQITNGKTNKYCRECGLRLEGLVEQAVQTEGAHAEQPVCPPDDVALGEELFDAWKLYEAGDLDLAAGSVEKIIECNPDSTSAHSILGRIYERKAEEEAGLGNAESARGFLRMALAQYERIIDLNPDSAADRVKLVSLRMRLAGHPGAAPVAMSVIMAPSRIGKKLVSLPPQVLAAGGAFIIVLVLGIVLLVLPGGRAGEGDGAKRAERKQPAADAISVTVTPSAPESSQMSSGGGGNPSGFKVYTYPTPSTPARPPAASLIPNAQSGEDVRPAKLPPISADLKIVPESKSEDTSAKKSEQAKPSQDKDGGARVKVTPAPTSEPARVPPAPSQPDGATMLARAIELGNQGRYQEAIASANQAVALFQEDVAAGKNTSAARLGADNANKYIRIWKQH